MKVGTKVSASGRFVGLASIAVTALLYYADARNIPVIAPWLDYLGDRIYHWMPILGRLAPDAVMWAPAIAVGLAFFLVVTVLVACFVPSSRIGTLESRMRGLQRRRRPRSVKVE